MRGLVVFVNDGSVGVVVGVRVVCVYLVDVAGVNTVIDVAVAGLSSFFLGCCCSVCDVGFVVVVVPNIRAATFVEVILVWLSFWDRVS